MQGNHALVRCDLAPCSYLSHPNTLPMSDLLCTHDLTDVSNAALRFALPLADRTGSKVTVLHVLPPGTPESTHATLRAKLKKVVEDAGGSDTVGVKLLEGRYMNVIPDESGKNYGMAVVGTHGPHGLRQNLFGADILKLVRAMHVPTMVVQEDTDLDRRLDRIVLPVAAHAEIDELLDAVCGLASLHGSEVHIYQLIRPNEQPSTELLNNKLRMLERFEQEGIPCVQANEPSDTFSVGFAQPTARYARRIGAGCIAIMAHASDEYRYIADAEKERMLTNEGSIPVLCV